MSNRSRDFRSPLRIPHSIELGVAEPDAVKAGEKGSWILKFLLARTVSQKQRIFLNVYGGRHNKISNYKYKWGNLQTQDPLKEGYVCLKNASGDQLQPIGISDDGGTLAFAVPKEGLRKREEVTAEIGGVAGVVTPMFSSPNKFFLLLEASPWEELRAPLLYGEEQERVVGACLMHVVGNCIKRLKTYAKSKAVVGKEIFLLARPEDEYGNVASEELGSLIVSLNGREVKAQRVPVKASTCCMLRGVVLQKPGVYRLQVTDISRDLKSFTNPIQCHAAPSSSGVLWGMIHGHTEISDGTGSLDHYFSYMRDECSLDFGATGDHDQLSETSDEIWQLAQETVAKNNEPGRFTTFLGYEWATWRMDGDGDRNVYYLYDKRPMYRMDDGCYPAPKDLFKALKSEKALIIPHHTAYRGSFCDWKDHETEKERLVEIYSMWGNSECSVNQGNPYPVKGGSKDERGSSEAPKGFVQRALELGWRVGFTAGGDDHIGHAGDQIIYWSYKAGLMAVYVQENTRESIWDAMWNRRCYGTTGARIIVDFQVDSHPMGSELLLSEHPKLAFKRKLSASIHGTEQVESVQIVRNNKDVYTRRPKSLDITFDWNDPETLADVNFPPAPYCPVPFTFYYLRVQQRDGEMAWASPIWILSNQTC